MDLMTYGLRPVDHGAAGDTVAGNTTTFKRRDFLVTSLAIGFAIAAKPVLAQAIHTDSTGLIAGEVGIPVGDGVIPGYRAMPADGDSFPVILVIQEIFGVHEHIKDVCRRFAKLGYLAIAPELFARQGDVSRMTEIGDILTKVVANVPDAQVFSDLDATVAFVKASGKADTNRLGIVGFCWGGRTVWLYARHNPDIKAGVAYYGLLNGMKSAIKAQDPIDIASSLQVPVLGLYAGNDAFIQPAIIDEMQKGLQQSGSGSEIIVFPAVSHGFNADYRPSYDKTAAQYGWKLTRDWLRSHGV